MLDVQHLSCVRGDRRLFRDIGFQLMPGELLYLQGHNGSGKTTLLRTLCGLVLPEEGEVRWQGENIRELRETFTRELLYLGHKNGIKDELTGLENLQTLAALDGFPIDEQNAWNALERIGLQGHEDLPTKVLSQGQKRRVALGRLLVNQSKLWILDEPFTALDQAAVRLLQEVVSAHLDQGGLAVLTTHQEVPLTSGRAKHLKLGWKTDV